MIGLLRNEVNMNTRHNKTNEEKNLLQNWEAMKGVMGAILGLA